VAVDITNYVLHEYGQPLHAFDADKVELPLTVRVAKKGERFTTLDKIERVLTAHDLVITDKQGIIGLAGVMGGLRTAVTDSTKRILVESATFDGVTVRKTAVRLGLRTEASARFERGLPVQLAALGLQRAGDILAAAAGGQAESPVYDSLKKLPPVRKVELSVARLNRILGMAIAPQQVRTSLEHLGFATEGSDTGFSVEVPWWRTDVALAEDLIEEVGRTIGYDKLPATLPDWHPTAVSFDRRQARLWEL
jgi:phenylalanyl-tRNA synthetase beta chain